VAAQIRLRCAEAGAMQVETDEPEVIERVAALDVGKAEVVCCVRVPGPGGQRMQEVRTISTMTSVAAIPSNRRDLKLADLGPPACSRSLLMGVARSRGPGRAEGPSFGLGLDPGEDDAMLGGREQAGHAALLGAGPAVEVCS
jgi:hypothetical protein